MGVLKWPRSDEAGSCKYCWLPRTADRCFRRPRGRECNPCVSFLTNNPDHPLGKLFKDDKDALVNTMETDDTKLQNLRDDVEAHGGSKTSRGKKREHHDEDASTLASVNSSASAYHDTAVEARELLGVFWPKRLLKPNGKKFTPKLKHEVVVAGVKTVGMVFDESHGRVQGTIDLYRTSKCGFKHVGELATSGANGSDAVEDAAAAGHKAFNHKMKKDGSGQITIKPSAAASNNEAKSDLAASLLQLASTPWVRWGVHCFCQGAIQ